MKRRGFFAALPGVAWLLHRVSRGEVPQGPVATTGFSQPVGTVVPPSVLTTATGYGATTVTAGPIWLNNPTSATHNIVIYGNHLEGEGVRWNYTG